MRRGFTVVELLIVVAVMGILATVSFTKFSRYINKLETSSLSYSLNSTAHAIRAKTYSTERVHWLKCIQGTFHVYQDIDGDEKLTDDDVELPSMQMDIPSGVDVSFTNSNAIRYGIKFSYHKMWWPAGSVVISTEDSTESYKVVFPVNSQSVVFYEKEGNEFVRR